MFFIDNLASVELQNVSIRYTKLFFLQEHQQSILVIETNIKEKIYYVKI